MDVSFFYVFLNNRLSDDLVSWYLNSFNSAGVFELSRGNNFFQLNVFVSFSVKLNVYVFSLNNRLDVSVVVNFFSWSGNSLGSGSFLKNRFSVDRSLGFVLSR